MLREYATLRAAIDAAEKNPLNTIHVIDSQNNFMELDYYLSDLRFLVDEEEPATEAIVVPPIVAETAVPVIEPEVEKMIEEADPESVPVPVLRQPKMSKEDFVKNMGKLNGGSSKKKLDVDLDRLKELRESGMSLKKIGEEMNMSEGSVYNYLKRMGV